MSRHFLNEFIRLCLTLNYYAERAGVIFPKLVSTRSA
jgi:hypothetical protein